jgi:hypothetical protein
MRVDLHNFYLRRVKLVSYVDALVELGEQENLEREPS